MTRLFIILLAFFCVENLIAQDFPYAGTYVYGTHPEGGPKGTLKIYPTSPTTLIFHLNLNRGAPSYNSGELVGEIKIASNREGDFTIKKDSDLINCSLHFWFQNDTVFIRTNDKADHCGYGFGVYSNGDYKRISYKTPEYFEDRTGEKTYFKNYNWKEWWNW